MSHSRHIALFGVTPLSLLLGRACCLADCPPVGLYDPDPENALRGALFLGISARQEPDQLDPAETPLQVALVGHERAAAGLSSLTPKGPLLTISLGRFVPPRDDLNLCLALPVNVREDQLSMEAISASIPELIFRLEGNQQARGETRELLRSLSPSIGFES